MIKLTLLIFVFLTSSNLWALPYMYEFDKDNTKMVVSCVEGVEPIANIGAIEQIAAHMDCDSQPVEKYCKCINKQHPNGLTDPERSVLEMELGFFGLQDDTKMLETLERMMRLQQVLTGYENVATGTHSCFKGNTSLADDDIDLSLQTVLKNLHSAKSAPLPYLKSSYIDMAKDLQRSVQAGEKINFDNEGEGDAKFLIELASTISNSKPELLTERFQATPDLLAPTGLMNQEMIGANEIVSWRDSIKAMIESKDRGEFGGSPLFQSLKETFESEKEGEYIPNRNAFFDSLVTSVRTLGLNKEDVENFRNGKKPDAKLIRKRMDSPFFSDAISKVANTMCLNLSSKLLWDAKTEDTTTGLMSVERVRKNASKGRALIEQFSVLDPSNVDDREGLREMLRVRNNMFEKMVSQFDDYREDHPSKEIDERIKAYINTKKISLGKLWCGERAIQKELLKVEEDKTIAENIDTESITALSDVDKLEEKHQQQLLEVTKLDKEFGDMKRRIDRYGDELSHSRTQLQLAEAELEALKQNPESTESDIEKAIGNIKGYRKNLITYPVLIRREEQKKTELVKKLVRARRSAERIKKQIEQRVESAVENNGWFEGMVVSRNNGEATGGSSNSSQPEGNPRADVKSVVTDAAKRRIVTEMRVVRATATVPSGPLSGAVNLVRKTHGEQRTVSYDTGSNQYKVRTNREEALDHKQITTKILNISRESISKGAKDETDEESLASISNTMATLANGVSANLDLTDAGMSEVEAFKKTVKKFDKEMTPVVGDMSFSALGEYEPVKSVNEITDTHLAKQLGEGKNQGQEVAASLAGALQNNIAPKTPVDSSIAPSSFIDPNIGNKPAQKVASPQSTPRVPGFSTDSSAGRTAREVAKSIFNERKKKVKKSEAQAPEEEQEVKEIDPAKAAEIARLKKEIELEKQANAKLDQEIEASSKKREALTKKAASANTEKDPVVATPGLKPSATPSPSSGRGSKVANRGPASVASSSVASAASSSNAVSSIVDGRVKGGVVVNGEFIPEALLSTKAASQVESVANSDLVLNSKSSYDLQPVSSENKISGVPLIKSDKFSKLSPEEKEVFIQKQLVLLKASKFVIEVEDGTNLLVSSTVKLRTRMKVSDLNKLFEKVDE